MGAIEAVNDSALIRIVIIGAIILSIIKIIQEDGIVEAIGSIGPLIGSIFLFFAKLALVLIVYLTGIFAAAMIMKKIELDIPSWIATVVAMGTGFFFVICADNAKKWIKNSFNKNHC